MRRVAKKNLKYRWYMPAILIALLAVLAFHKPGQVQKRISELTDRNRQIQHVERGEERKHIPARLGWEPASDSNQKE